jgi:acyl-coenzyme A thioesterase 9
VFKALASMRVRKPWIEALREKKELDKHPVSAPEQSMKADLTPKKMSDSYTSVVLPLSVSAPEYKTHFSSLTNALRTL